jgi:hypothetical protein
MNLNMLETTKARARIYRRARNQARADLRSRFLQCPADLLEFMNKRLRDLEIATEADAQATLIANLISNRLAAEAWRQIPPHKPSS